jgi:hypothetical protein
MASPSGILRYPYEAITDTTDYLQITIKKNKRLGDGEKEKYIQNAAYAYSSNPASVSGISASFLKPQVLAENGVILLPMPSNIQDSNSVSYDNDSMNAISGFAAGEVLELIKNPSGFGDTLGSVMGDSSSDEGRTKGIFANNQLKNLALKSIAAQAVNVFGANVSLNQLLARGSGTILNPNMELLFNNVTLRTFDFSFKMTPRDENESTQVKSIIRSLKMNMAPSMGETASENLGRLYLHTPNIFELHYKKGNKLHPFLNRFKQCALSDMKVNYTGENVYATYNDGTPISLVLNLTFKELVPIYKEDYNDDAFTEGQDSTYEGDAKPNLTYGITNGVQANVEGVGF